MSDKPNIPEINSLDQVGTMESCSSSIDIDIYVSNLHTKQKQNSPNAKKKRNLHTILYKTYLTIVQLKVNVYNIYNIYLYFP